MTEFAAFVEAQAMQAAEGHVAQMAALGKEGIGLLLGNRFSWKGGEFVWADEFVTAENQATAVSVQFSRQAFSRLAEQLRRRAGERVVVGWLHSHPGYGCFLSATDVQTQKRYFDESYHFAVVVDPKRSQQRQMEKRAFRVQGSQFYEIPFAVVEEK